MPSNLKWALTGTALALAIVGCSQVPEASATASSDSAQDTASRAAGAQSVTIDAIAAIRAEPIEEQLITCSHTNGMGNKLTNFFVLTDGRAKSYSSFRNFARDLCDPGQPQCAQGWMGDKIASYSVNGNGFRNQYLVDVDALTMERAFTRTDGSVEVTQYQCTSEALPEGITIE